LSSSKSPPFGKKKDALGVTGLLPNWQGCRRRLSHLLLLRKLWRTDVAVLSVKVVAANLRNENPKTGLAALLLQK